MKKSLSLLALACCCLAVSSTQAQERRIQFKSTGQQPSVVNIEVLDDDLLHIQLKKESAPNTDVPSSEMIHKTDYAGPSSFSQATNSLETKDIKLIFNPASATITLIDKTKNNAELVSLTGFSLEGEWRGIRGSKKPNQHIYGLGQQFDYQKPGNVNSDWNGKKREGGKYGNEMIYANEGASGNTQIPVMYAVNGSTYENYALLLDNVYKHRWDFTRAGEWTAEANGGDLNFYLMTGTDLKDLHADYMELTGRAPLPPKKMFGLWISEYGFDNWEEMDSKLTSLRKNNFPVDGFVFDLQWFGNIGSKDSKMGNLAWDNRIFPDARNRIATYEKENGVGFIVIEEPYVDKGLPEYEQMAKQGLLAVYSTDKTNAYVLPKAWWGQGGMFDYTNPKTSEFIHNTKRKALIEDGILGHWTDLGEPENYNDTATYYKGVHKDIHNMFGFYWSKGLYEGYQNSQVRQRPFIMARSGTAGIQRFGTAMWSGDVPSRLTTLAAQTANQANMAFSGIDYYGSDIGGFHRNLEKGAELNDVYTRWFAYGSLFEIPVRPHVANIDTAKAKETAPDRIGDINSNLANVRLRYRLLPYLYSLAYRAHTAGELIYPPLVYHYQADKNVAALGDHKMIGEYMLGVATVKDREKAKDVYLPAGTWYDWRTLSKISSKGGYLKKVSLYRDNMLTLPLYVREGAIIPMMFVDDQTMNVFGRRKDGSVRNELMLRVVPSAKATEFTLYEDDGKTVDYLNGINRTTVIRQQFSGNAAAVTIEAAKGSYQPDETRSNEVTLITDRSAQSVKLNGTELKKYNTEAELAAAESGFVKVGNSIVVKSGKMNVKDSKKFEITF